MTGNVVTGATLTLNATTNAGPMNALGVYARAVSDTGAWDNSSVVSTFETLTLGNIVLSGQTLSVGTGTKTFNILGDASKGVQQFYDDYPSGGDITLAFLWSAFSGTPNGVLATLTIGDDDVGTPLAVFSPYNDATYYPRVTIDYTF
jgi:hypothetical protein